jgi:RNA polymerase sigma-70 factor (ECF subfamily)
VCDSEKKTDEDLIGVVGRAEAPPREREAAFMTLVARHEGRLLRWVVGRGVPHEDAEDLLQQLWMEVHRSAAGFDAGRGRFALWLYRMARVRIIDQFRASQRRTTGRSPVKVEGLADCRPEPLREAIDREAMHCVWETITGDIGERESEVLSLRFTGLSYGEIANLLGITDEAARQTASRAMRWVRRCLEEKGILDEPA